MNVVGFSEVNFNGGIIVDVIVRVFGNGYWCEFLWVMIVDYCLLVGFFSVWIFMFYVIGSFEWLNEGVFFDLFLCWSFIRGICYNLFFVILCFVNLCFVNLCFEV